MNKKANHKGSNSLPPAIVLGGGANAVSIARSLGREGILVHVLNSSDSCVRYSRYAKWIQCGSDGDSDSAWEDFLLSECSDYLRGAVLLSACDIGIDILIRHRKALAKKFLLDISDVEAQRCALSKILTYKKALECGLRTPRFWNIGDIAELYEIGRELPYPLIVKPDLTFRFKKSYSEKFFIAKSFYELMEQCKKLFEQKIDFVLLEIIPGPDDRLCSYYTYIDEEGTPLFHFTKRIIRRYPKNRGGACYHITDYNPEVIELGLKLFRHIELRGLGNVEFKLDERDNQLKVIECNARFTAANCLVSRSGYDLALLVYNNIAGRPHPDWIGKQYAAGMRLWDPIGDYRSYRELKKNGEIEFGSWLKSIVYRQTFPYFSWMDPEPSIFDWKREVLGYLSRKISGSS